MRALAAAFSLFALAPALVSSAQAQSKIPAPQPPLPPETPLPEGIQPGDRIYGPQPAAEEPEPPNDPSQAPLASPDEYAADIDNDVAYDDAVAQRYDDGYDPEAYSRFDQTLSPYGSWVDDDAYGRVWIPATSVVGDDFSPYATGGHWVQTEYGWTWVSDWDWGWAPFHYGRWAVLDSGRWGWLPGTIWGPAWVAWRSGNGYVGWAPLPPRRVTVGSPLGPYSPWRFMRASDLGCPNRPYLPPRMVPGVFGRMTVVSNMRTLSNGGTNVHVNIGPTLVGRPAPAGNTGLYGKPATGGSAVGPALAGKPPALTAPPGLQRAPGQSPLLAPAPAPARLSVVAPQALPRYAITPRVGYPVAARPWIQASIVRPVPRFGPSGGMAWNPPEQRGAGYGRMSAPGPYGQPVSGTYRMGSGFAAPGFRTGPGAGFRGGAPAFRAGSSPPFRGASPTFRGAPASAFRGAAPPVFRGPAPSPVFHGAPGPSRGFSGSPAPHVSAPTFSHPSGGFRPSFGGGGRSFGGGHRR